MLEERDRQTEEEKTWFSIFLMPVEIDRQTEKETDLVLHLSDASRER
jgi:hypothetical protein